MALSNLGDEVVFTNDPSCDYYFEIYNDLEEQIYSTQSQCRGQAQTKSIDAKSTEILQTKTWDFIVENGSYIESGNYELRLLHSSLPLEETIELYYQQKSGLEDGLEYLLNSIDNTILVSLSNPTNAIVYPSSDYCTIAISIENSSSAHRLCNETTDIIYPNQNIYYLKYYIC